MAPPPPKPGRIASTLRSPRLQWFAFSAYAALLAAVSLLPSKSLPKIPNWSDLFSPDKVAHFGAYAIFAVLLSLPLYARYNFRGILAAVVASASFGALMEFLQGVSGMGRDADYVDMVANLLGAILGGLLFLLATKFTTTAFPTGRAYE